MAKITIDGESYRVVDNMGYNHDIGGYAKIVETPDGNRTAVKQPGRGSLWRFWTARDRTAPLRAALSGQARGER